MKTSTRTRLGLGSTTLVAALAVLTLTGPTAPAQAYGTSQDELASACENGIDQVGITVNCTFEADHVSGYHKVWHRYGDPVTNCEAGSTHEASVRIDASRTETQTWTVGGKFSFPIKSIGIEGNSSYSNSVAITNTVARDVTAWPGEKAAATVGTTMATEEGRIRVDIIDNGGVQDGYGSGFSDTYYIDGVKRDVPTGEKEDGRTQAACGAPFDVDPENSPIL